MKYFPFVLWITFYPLVDSFSLYVYFTIHQVMQHPIYTDADIDQIDAQSAPPIQKGVAPKVYTDADIDQIDAQSAPPIQKGVAPKVYTDADIAQIDAKPSAQPSFLDKIKQSFGQTGTAIGNAATNAYNTAKQSTQDISNEPNAITQNEIGISSVISFVFYVWIAIVLWKKAGKL